MKSAKVSASRDKNTAMEQVMISRLKRIRKAAALSQKQLAEKIGLDHTAISNIERSERHLSLGEFMAWCEACGTTATAVLNGDPISIEIAG